MAAAAARCVVAAAARPGTGASNGGGGGGGGSSLLQMKSVTTIDAGVTPSPSGTGDGFVRLTATTGCGGDQDAEPADALQADPRFTG